MPELPDIDGQDIAEVFDEDNLDRDAVRLARDDEELNFDDMPDVYDGTRADSDEDEEDPDDVGLTFAGDLNTTPGAHSAAQRYEARNLSDEDLAELGYKDAPKESRTFDASPEAEDAADKAKEKADDDERLDEGVEETFPASDPVSVKHIT